jgi:adenylate cyclase, class 2
MKHLNIEIKAKCSNLEKIRTILLNKKSDFKGVDHQIDTYFKVNSGRLKLREGNIENHLIHYSRENKTGPKQSNVILFESNPNSTLKEILTKSLDVLAVIDKKREIYFIENVKFHLDDVKNLGTFVEIEAIAENNNLPKEKLLEQCNNFMKLFNIPKEDLISNSYSDMVLL